MDASKADNEDKIELYIRKYIFQSQEEYSRPLAKLLQRCQEHYFQERGFKAYTAELERLCGGLKGKKILEIGSGSGGRTVALALEGAEIYGIEPNESGVMASCYRSKRYPGLKATFAVGVGEYLGFKNNFFDLIITYSVLEHVRDIDRVLRETFRVLKEGGFTYHHTENNLWPRENHYRIFWPPLCPKHLARVYVKLRGKNPKFLSHLNYITPSFLRIKLGKALFFNIRDVGAEGMIEKFNNPESISLFLPRWVAKLSSFIGLNRILGKSLAKSGIYSSTLMLAQKPDKKEKLKSLHLKNLKDQRVQRKQQSRERVKVLQ